MESSYAFIHDDQGKLMLGQIDGGKLILYKDFSSPISNIYRARVEKYIKSLDAFILDIGLDKKGLLRASQAPKDLKASDQIIVELTKLGDEDKLYELTAKFTITDSFIVLKRRLNSRDFEVFKRTKGKLLDQDAINEKTSKLSMDFFRLIEEENFTPTPKLLRKNTKLEEFIDSFDGSIYNFSKTFDHEKTIRKDYEMNTNLEIVKGLNEVNDRVIGLEKGLELVFDKTCALTVVDINTGGFGQDLPKEKLSFQANLLILDDLARLISIKNIKKMLMIDFIRIKSNKNKEELIEEFRKCLEKYNVKSQLLGFTKMELFEMIVQ